MKLERPSNRAVVEWIVSVIFVALVIALAVGSTQHPDEPLVGFAPD
jgi:hypothetical protein